MTEDFDHGRTTLPYEDYLQDAMEDDVPYVSIRGEDYQWWAVSGQRMFEQYVEWRRVTNWDIEAIEDEFRVQPEGLQLPVVGFIDRRFRTSTGVHVIVDLKTGYRLPQGSKQLPLYAAAHRSSSSRLPSGSSSEEGRIATAYYHSRSGDSTGFEWPDADQQWLVDYVQPVERRLLAGDFEPNPSASNCRYCPVAPHCEFRYGRKGSKLDANAA